MLTCSSCFNKSINCQYSTTSDGRKPASKPYVQFLRDRTEVSECVLRAKSIDIGCEVSKQASGPSWKRCRRRQHKLCAVRRGLCSISKAPYRQMTRLISDLVLTSRPIPRQDDQDSTITYLLLCISCSGYIEQKQRNLLQGESRRQSDRCLGHLPSELKPAHQSLIRSIISLDST